MIKSMKGKLLSALGIALIVFIALATLELSVNHCSESCNIVGKCTVVCTPILSILLPYALYLAAPLFIVIFLILHIISRYKK